MNLLFAWASVVHAFDDFLETPEEPFIKQFIYPSRSFGAIDSDLLPNRMELRFIALYPVTSFALQPSASPSPSPTPDFDEDITLVAGEDDEFDQTLTLTTSMIANLDIEEAPLSLNLSSLMPSLSSLPPSDTPSLPAATSEISSSELQKDFPTISNLISYIDSHHNNLEGVYNTASGGFELSYAVLTALEHVLTQQGGSSDQKAQSGVFRRLFSSLNINLLWPITDQALLIRILEAYFAHPGQVQILLSYADTFMSYMIKNNLVSERSRRKLQIYLLQLIVTRMKAPHIRHLLSKNLFFNAFWIIVLTDSSIQQRLGRRPNSFHITFASHGEELSANRRIRYRNLFIALTAFYHDKGMTHENIKTFLNYLFELIRQHPPMLCSVAELQCQPVNNSALLLAAEEAIRQNPTLVTQLVQLLESPALFQAAAVFINHLNTLGAQAQATACLTHLLDYVPSGTLINTDLVQIANWGISALAATVTCTHPVSQIWMDIAIQLAPETQASGQAAAFAQHLNYLLMLMLHDPSTVQATEISPQLMQSIKNILGKIVLGVQPASSCR